MKYKYFKTGLENQRSVKGQIKFIGRREAQKQIELIYAIKWKIFMGKRVNVECAEVFAKGQWVEGRRI
jgi:hypothetical protein